MDVYVVASSKRRALIVKDKVKEGRLPSSFICSTEEKANKRLKLVEKKLSVPNLKVYKLKGG